MTYEDKVCDVCGATFTPCAPNALRCSDACRVIVRLQKQREWYAKNPSKYCQRVKQYYAENSDKVKEYQKRYNVVNEGKVRERYHKYYVSRNILNFLGKSVPMVEHDKAPPGYLWHHTCYDHANPEANIELVTYQTHAMGHNLLRKLGIEIPHINEQNK